KRLGLHPNNVQVRGGEPFARYAKRPADTGVWTLHTKNRVDSRDLAEHLRLLLLELQPAKDQLLQLKAEKYKLLMKCYVQTRSDNATVYINPGMLQLLGYFGFQLMIDVYMEDD